MFTLGDAMREAGQIPARKDVGNCISEYIEYNPWTCLDQIAKQAKTT